MGQSTDPGGQTEVRALVYAHRAAAFCTYAAFVRCMGNGRASTRERSLYGQGHALAQHPPDAGSPVLVQASTCAPGASVAPARLMVPCVVTLVRPSAVRRPWMSSVRARATAPSGVRRMEVLEPDAVP